MPPSTKIVPPFLSVPEFVIVPPVVGQHAPIKLVPDQDSDSRHSHIQSIASGKLQAFRIPVVSSVTVLVPFRMQAFVEAVGVPLVQLPLRSQKLLPPFCHVVEGALRPPH